MNVHCLRTRALENEIIENNNEIITYHETSGVSLMAQMLAPCDRTFEFSLPPYNAFPLPAVVVSEPMLYQSDCSRWRLLPYLKERTNHNRKRFFTFRRALNKHATSSLLDYRLSINVHCLYVAIADSGVDSVTPTDVSDRHSPARQAAMVADRIWRTAGQVSSPSVWLSRRGSQCCLARPDAG